MKTKNPNAVALGKLGGSKTSARKKLSSKKNGKKGGRPKSDKKRKNVDRSTFIRNQVLK